MKTVIFSKKLGDVFGKKYMPKLYINLLVDEINNKKYVPLLLRLNETFNITKSDLVKAINIENLIVSEFDGQYVLYFNDVKIKNSISLKQVIDYMNDGDLSLRGYNLFNEIVSYINNNIFMINQYYLMRGY